MVSAQSQANIQPTENTDPIRTAAIIGPAHPLRGGLATFNHRLAKAFNEAGIDCSIFSYSLQYPSILFPGKTQYTDEPAPAGITIHSIINSINPINWWLVGNRIRKDRPDLIVVRYWLPFMGPALGTILRRVRKNRHTRIICIADNIQPHEKRPGDKFFTRYFIRACHGFITMSQKVMDDLRLYDTQKPAALVRHPLYDNFGEPVAMDEARRKLGIPTNARVLLFFGFIRHYKGLDLLLKAMCDPRVRELDVHLLIAGEFYEDPKQYADLLDDADVQPRLFLHTDFIPDSEVRWYWSAADAVVQPYRQATQSGVTPLAYHFEKPMVVTRVGGLPDMVPDQKVGLVVEPKPEAIAGAIVDFYRIGQSHFIPHLRAEKQQYTWAVLVEAILPLAKTDASSGNTQA